MLFINLMKLLLTLFAIFLLFSAVTCEKDYTDFVHKIKSIIEDKNSHFHHSAYERLAYISDTYGPRMWGSEALEQVIHEVFTMAHKEGFENIRLESVKNFTKWVRGEEELLLHSPRPVPTKLNLIGLGGTVSG